MQSGERHPLRGPLGSAPHYGEADVDKCSPVGQIVALTSGFSASAHKPGARYGSSSWVGPPALDLKMQV